MGLFSKIFKGIKKVVKGVAKVIKKTVKGVAKVVKKVAKSKIFKAVLAAAAIYVTGGAAAGAFGASGSTGMFGKWATQYGSGIFSSGIGKAVATPFHMLGSAIGTGARAITDFTGITEKGAELGAEAIQGAGDSLLTSTTSEISGTMPSTMAPTAAQQAVSKETVLAEMAKGNIPTDAALAELGLSRGEIWKQHAANIASSQGVGPSASAAATKGSGWGKWAAGVGTSVATNVATGYVMNKITEEDPTGQMSGLAVEGEGQLDPFAVYYADGKPLSVAEVYSQLLYGTGDPITNGGNTSNLYIQDIAPVPA